MGAAAEPKRGRGRPRIGSRVELRLPDELGAAVAAEAEAEQVPVAEIVRRAVADRYARRQKGRKATS